MLISRATPPGKDLLTLQGWGLANSGVIRWTLGIFRGKGISVILLY